ncbi:hypothetical protein SBV1_80005 [Verrucomicrobia bacterium]|nr:hypothetical protein SBV1_80005 [Verrucomicrobiota bacterium]
MPRNIQQRQGSSLRKAPRSSRPSRYRDNKKRNKKPSIINVAETILDASQGDNLCINTIRFLISWQPRMAVRNSSAPSGQSGGA